MVPKGIRAKALLVYKVFLIDHVGNFGHPFGFYSHDRCYNVLNNLPWVHGPFSTRKNMETHVIWGNHF